MTDGTHRGSPRITDEQWDTFFEHLTETGNVSFSCKKAAIGATNTVYRRALNEEEFGKRFEDAKAIAIKVRCDMALGTMTRMAEGNEIPITTGKGVVLRNDGSVWTKFEADYRAVAFILERTGDAVFKPPATTPVAMVMPSELMPDPEPVPDEPGPDKPIL